MKTQAIDFAILIAIFAICILVALPQKSGQEPGKIDFLEGLRAVAALSVLACHAIPMFRWFIDGTYGSAVSSNLGPLGVQIFFCITGFLFTRKIIAGKFDAVSFVASRLRRMLPMYTATIAAVVAIALIYTRAEPTDPVTLARQIFTLYGEGVSWGGLSPIKSFDTGPVIGTIWTLPLEWWFYMCMPFLAYAASDRRLTIAAGGFIAAYSAWLIATKPDGLFVLFFVPGMVAAVLQRWIESRNRPWLGLLGVAIGLLCVFGEVQGYDARRLLLVSVMFLALVFGAPRLLAWGPLAYLGKISYSIYLLQLPLLFLARWLLANTEFTVFNSPFLRCSVLVAYVVAVMVISALTFRFIEMPFMHRAVKRQSYARFSADAQPTGNQ